MKYLFTLLAFTICFQVSAVKIHPIVKSKGFQSLSKEQKEIVLKSINDGAFHQLTSQHQGTANKKAKGLRMDSSRFKEYTDGDISYTQKNEYTYTEIGKLGAYWSRIDYDGSQDSFYVKFHYNAKNQPIALVTYRINMNDEWGITDSAARSYDENGQMTVENYFESNGFSYTSSYLVEYEYNKSLQLTSETYKFDLGNGLQNLFKSIYVYDENGKLSEIKSATWDNGKFVDDDKVTITYKNGFIDSTVHYEFVVNQWEVYGFDTYSWSNGKLNQYNTYSLEADQWVNDYKMSFSYDKVVNLDAFTEIELTTNLFAIYFFGSEFLPTYSKSQEWVVDQWEMDDEEYYFYSEKEVASISSQVVYTADIYPNPANEFITINSDLLGQVEVLNTLGQSIWTQEKSLNTIKIDVQNWETGLYTLRIVNGTQSTVQKFMVH